MKHNKTPPPPESPPLASLRVQVSSSATPFGVDGIQNSPNNKCVMIISPNKTSSNSNPKPKTHINGSKWGL